MNEVEDIFNLYKKKLAAQDTLIDSLEKCITVRDELIELHKKRVAVLEKMVGLEQVREECVTAQEDNKC